MTLCEPCQDRYTGAGATVAPTTTDGLAPREGTLF